MRPRDTPESLAVTEKLTAALASDGFLLVYQGGHHDVFCDGKTHKTTNGGWTLIESRYKLTGSYPCDCARWKDGRSGHPL